MNSTFFKGSGVKPQIESVAEGKYQAIGQHSSVCTDILDICFCCGLNKSWLQERKEGGLAFKSMSTNTYWPHCLNAMEDIKLVSQAKIKPGSG